MATMMVKDAVPDTPPRPQLIKDPVKVDRRYAASISE